MEQDNNMGRDDDTDEHNGNDTAREYNMGRVNLPDNIPVDEDYGDLPAFEARQDVADSAYSTASSIYNFRVEGGRAYHDYRDGHPFPHDEVSGENEVCLHNIMLLLLDGQHYFSPVDKASLRCVVDVGGGREALWTKAMADECPDATIIDIDTTPPAEDLVAPNSTWIDSDACDEWILNDENMKVDLVYVRNLFAQVRDWESVYANAFEMRSGGWIEHTELEIRALTDDDSAPPNSQVVEMSSYPADFTTATAREWIVTDKMKERLEQAGFVDVQESRFKLPLGPWPLQQSEPELHEIGKFFERFYKTGVQGWLLQTASRHFGWTIDDVNAACTRAFQEIDSRRSHFYFPLVVVTGRKP